MSKGIVTWVKSKLGISGNGAAVTRDFVVLRDIRTPSDTRFLAATQVRGTLEIEGHDYGDGVEAIFGEREYEWCWSLDAEAVVQLRLALALTQADDLMEHLSARFSNEDAAGLQLFLNDHQITYQAWSRTGG